MKCVACEIDLPPVAGPLCAPATMPSGTWWGDRSTSCWEAFLAWAGRNRGVLVAFDGREPYAPNLTRAELEVLIDQWLEGRDLATLRARVSAKQRLHARMLNANGGT